METLNNNINSNSVFYSDATPELFELVNRNKIESTERTSIVSDLIGKGELIHLSGESYNDAAYFAAQICLTVCGANNNFIGLPVSTYGNCLFINDWMTPCITQNYLELLCRKSGYCIPTYQMAVYNARNDNTQSIVDVLGLIKTLKPVLIVLDSLIMSYDGNPEELPGYPLANLVISLCSLLKASILVLSKGQIVSEHVSAFRQLMKAQPEKKTPFVKSFSLHCINQTSGEYLLCSPGYPNVFEAFVEEKLQKDAQTLWFRKPHKRFPFVLKFRNAD